MKQGVTFVLFIDKNALDRPGVPFFPCRRARGCRLRWAIQQFRKMIFLAGTYCRCICRRRLLPRGNRKQECDFPVQTNAAMGIREKAKDLMAQGMGREAALDEATRAVIEDINRNINRQITPAAPIAQIET